MCKRTKILYGIESAGGGSLKHLVYLVTNLSKEKFEITVIYSETIILVDTLGKIFSKKMV